MRPAVGGPIIGASLASISVGVGECGDVGDMNDGDVWPWPSHRFNKFCHSALYSSGASGGTVGRA